MPKEIKLQENYEKDLDYIDAIFTNYKAIIKFLDNLISAFGEIRKIDPNAKFIEGASVEGFEKEKEKAKQNLEKMTTIFGKRLKEKRDNQLEESQKVVEVIN